MNGKARLHNGIINFTIGQRKGIKVSDKDALYVIKIDAKNEIIVGPRENSENIISLNNINLLTDKKDFEKEILVKVRSTGKLLKAKINFKNNNEAIVELKIPEDGISPGKHVYFITKMKLVEF